MLHFSELRLQNNYLEQAFFSRWNEHNVRELKLLHSLEYSFAINSSVGLFVQFVVAMKNWFRAAFDEVSEQKMIPRPALLRNICWDLNNLQKNSLTFKRHINCTFNNFPDQFDTLSIWRRQRSYANWLCSYLSAAYEEKNVSLWSICEKYIFS